MPPFRSAAWLAFLLLMGCGRPPAPEAPPENKDVRAGVPVEPPPRPKPKPAVPVRPGRGKSVASAVKPGAVKPSLGPDPPRKIDPVDLAVKVVLPRVTGFHLMPDGKTLVVQEGEALRLRDATSGESLHVI